MHAELVKKINRYFHDEEAVFFGNRHNRRIQNERNFYECFFRKHSAAGGRRIRVLDIGSGTGLVGSALPKDGYEIVSTDISCAMLNTARGGLKSEFGEYVACDAENLPFKSGIFDIITCNAAMHHFPSIDKFARETQRVLAPLGTLIIGFETNRKFWTTPPVSLLYRAIARLRRKRRPGDPNYGFVCRRVNEKLLTEKLITEPIKDVDIFTLVDAHSPNAGGTIDRSKGFDTIELTRGVFKDYKATVFYHYDCNNRVFGAFNRIFFPKSAPQISMVLEKHPKVKVLFIFVHLNYGGAEVGLLTTLKNIDRNRFDCTVVSIEKRGAVGEAIEGLGFKVVYLDSSARLFNVGLIKKMARILRETNPDILHTSLFYANFFGRVAALLNRPAAILTEERSMYTEKRLYHIVIDRILSAITDKIIVCSNSVLDFTIKQEKIDKSKFRLMYNAVDADRFDMSKSKDAVRSEYGFPEDGFIIGTVGSLIPKKGHCFLIEAISGLTRDIPRVKLLIIGEGEKRAELTRLAGSKCGNGRVMFLGNRSYVPDLMKAMDLFVLPSLQEGFPRTIIEAMYSGLPVVASNISGIPEIISDGKNGLLVPAGDPAAIGEAILRLYRDPGLRKTLGEEARKNIGTSHMPKAYVGKLQDLYLELMENRKR